MVSPADLWSESSSDAELITAARGGDSSAFGTLYERHSAAARAVARQYTRSSADAEDVAADAFARVFAVVQSGGGPDVAFRAYLFTVVRRLAYAGAQSERKVAPTDDMVVFETAFGPQGSVEDPAMAGFERGVVAKAYASLPERWQAALWYTEVEGLSAAQIAPLLGLTANGVAALSYRAREGLRQAYLQQHLATPLTDGCRGVIDKLGAYVRGGLAHRETSQVETHIEGCDECRALVLELGDVNHGMRAFVAPLIVGLAGMAALAHPLPVGGLLLGAGAGAGAGVAAGGAGAGVAAGTTAASTGAGLTGAGVAGGAGVSAAAGTATVGTATVGTAAVGTAAVGTAATASLGGVAAGTAAVGAGAAGSAAAGTIAAGTVAAGAGAAVATSAVGASAAAAATAVGAGAAAGTGIAAGAGAGALVGAGAVSSMGVATGALATGAFATGLTSAAGLAGIGAAGAGVAAGAVATTGGVAAVVASIPMGIASAVMAGIVGASLAVAGATGAFTDDTPATKSVVAAAPTATPSAAPDASGAAAGPADVPALDVPTFGAVPDPATDRGSTPRTSGVADASVPGVPADASVPTASPSGTPTTTPTPAPPSLSLAVSSAAGGLALTAGSTGVLTFDLENSGDSTAQNVRVDLTLPDGVVYSPSLGDSVTSVSAGGFSVPREIQYLPWSCAAGAGTVTVSCTVAELPGLTTAELSVRVWVGESVEAAAAVRVDLAVGSDSTESSTQLVTTTSIGPAPTRVVVDPTSATLTVGVESIVTIGVRNAGAVAAQGAHADVALPAGVTVRPPDSGPWSCAATGDPLVLSCSTDDLGPRGSAPLSLAITADASAAPAATLSVTVTFDGAAAGTSIAVPVTVSPAPAPEPEA